MGYDLHITRGVIWWEEGAEQIALHEWAGVVAADPDLEMVQVARASVNGQVLEYRNDGLAQMVTHPRADTDGAWLDWREGRIVVKNPDDVLIAKMREIAVRLRARVQGDDGEYYDG